MITHTHSDIFSVVKYAKDEKKKPSICPLQVIKMETNFNFLFLILILPIKQAKEGQTSASYSPDVPWHNTTIISPHL